MSEKYTVAKPQVGRPSDSRVDARYLATRPELSGLSPFDPASDVDVVDEVNRVIGNVRADIVYADPELGAAMLSGVEELDRALTESVQGTAVAQNTLATLSRASSFGVLRATKTDLDAAFAGAPVGATGTDAETGDVYLKVQGAGGWGSPITNTSAGTVDGVRFGVRSGRTPEQIVVAIDAALSYSASTGTEVIFRHDVTVSRTIVPPAGAKFRMSPSGKWRPSGDFSVIRQPTYAGECRPRVDISGVADYSSIAIELDGSPALYGAFRMPYCRVEGSTAHTQSRGVHIRSNTGFVAGISLGRIECTYVAYPYLEHANTVNPVGNTGYVNSVTVASLWCNAPIIGIDKFGETGEIAGSRILDYEVQSKYGASQRSVRTRGNVTDQVICGKTWDWSKSASPSLAIELSPTGGSCYVRDVRLDATAVRKADSDVFENAGRTRSPRTNTITPPMGINNRSFVGDQNDFLAFADKRFTLTYTGPSSEYAHDPFYAFRPSPDDFASWSGLQATDTLVFEINLGRVWYYLDTIGVQFDFGMSAQRVQFEIQDSTGTWYTLLNRTDNTNIDVVLQNPNQNGTWGAQRIRVTLQNPVSSQGKLRLNRIWARCGGDSGYTWLSRRDGERVFGNMYFGQNGDQFGYHDGNVAFRQRSLPKNTTGTAKWFKLARIQGRNPIDGGESAQFTGFAVLGGDIGVLSNAQSVVQFGFGIRQGSGAGTGATIKPVLIQAGDGNLGEWRIYKTADGWHDLYLLLPAYSAGATFQYAANWSAGITEYFVAADPTTDATLTLAWSSAGGSVQALRIGGRAAATTDQLGYRTYRYAGSTQTLTATDQLVGADPTSANGSIVLTLPLASALPGLTLEVVNTAPAGTATTVTVVTQGTDRLQRNLTSLVIPNDKSVRFMARPGSTTWFFLQ